MHGTYARGENRLTVWSLVRSISPSLRAGPKAPKPLCHVKKYFFILLQASLIYYKKSLNTLERSQKSFNF